MSGPLTRDALLAAGRITTERVPVGDGWVTVRALSRAQALAVRAAGRDPAQQEPLILHHGVADPELSLPDAEKWLETAPAGELQHVLLAIARLSGMDEPAGKERTKSAAHR